jgi:hypothetical protein
MLGEGRRNWITKNGLAVHAGIRVRQLPWLTSFVLPLKVVCDADASLVGHMDMQFLVPVPEAGMHITVQ